MEEQLPVSLSWFREHLVDELLSCWYKAAINKTGFFYPNLTCNWNRKAKAIGTLVSQSRLLYVFSQGYLITGKPEYKEAVNSGAGFLIRYFKDHEYKGYAWSCSENGEVVDYTKDAYGHAFLILGLCLAYRATGEITFLEEALAAYQIIRFGFFEEKGGVIWKKTRDWIELDKIRSQNPMMHLFEALLELGNILKLYKGKNNFSINPEKIFSEAGRIADFIFSLTSTNSRISIPEFYTKEWEPISIKPIDPAMGGGYWVPGHQFEWAFLLSLGVEYGMPGSYLKYANACLCKGLEIGYEKDKGYIHGFVDKNGEIVSSELSWWEQSEALRAMIHFYLCHNRKDLSGEIKKLYTFINKFFIDHEYGGWYASLDMDGKAKNTDKGIVWKLDYHQVALCAEVIRLKEKFNS